MHSNNDGMPPDWKPTHQSEFKVFINAKKTKYNLTHEGTFNTVHVTDWAEEYVDKIETQLTQANARIEELESEILRLTQTVDAYQKERYPFSAGQMMRREQELVAALSDMGFHSSCSACKENQVARDQALKASAKGGG